jgi:maltose/moltooligosaccharide transporter
MSTTSITGKPRLSIAQIINMSVGFFGIQFAFGLQNANVSRIFQTLGAKIEEIPILWIAAPLTGLIVQPIIGHMSDKTWIGKLGRRRPYFLAGAIFASLALLIFPGVEALWMAAVMLWLLDASINISMEPFRAFVGDLLPDEQRTTGFAMQSFFIGVGAVISSLLPYILTSFGIANEAAPGIIPDSVQYSFIIGAIVYMLAITYTVVTTKEYSPEELKNFGEESATTHQIEIKTSAKNYRIQLPQIDFHITFTLGICIHCRSFSFGNSISYNVLLCCDWIALETKNEYVPHLIGFAFVDFTF